MRLRLRILLGLVPAVLLPGPAAAQFSPPAPAAVGERYHVELVGGLWNPSPALVIASSALGIDGTDIDFVDDLGIERTRFREFRVVLRPARKHKFRLQYVPIRYETDTTLARDVVFNGTRFPAGLPVGASLEWRAWRFGYEYDFIARSRGFIGVIAEVKYTQVEADIESLGLGEATRARAPIPAVGGIARGYLLPNVAVTFEMTGFRVPERLDENIRGKYLEFDLYGTGNFSENFGVQIGYRSIDANYVIDEDTGNLKVKGIYFAGVVRF